MKIGAYICGIILIVIGVGCHTTKTVTTGESVQLNELKISGASSAGTFRAAAPKTWDLVRTTVALTFNYKEKTANGRANILIKPHLNDTSLIVLDAKGMLIDTVALISFTPFAADDPRPMEEKSKKLIMLPHTYNNKELRITLPKPWRSYYEPAPASVLALLITYKAMPYADSTETGSAAISEARGLYFINTDNSIPNKPAQIWTQGETESNSHWLPTIDKPNQRTTVDITLTVPDTMQTLSNGELMNSVKLGNGLRKDHWEMNQPIQPYAIMFAIGRFNVIKDEHVGVPVAYYVEPRFAEAGLDIFKGTPAMIDYFSKVTGVPYPWNKYSQIVVRDYVSGAMENTSASLFGEFMNGTRREVRDKTGNEDVVSHELFHQWFGDYVTAESWSNLTLNESFATYGEVLWRRASQGQSSADELATDDLNRYLQSTESKDPPLVRYSYADKEDMFDRISYQKGGAILRYMHGLMGDTAFSRSMKQYLTRNALHPAEAAHWRMAVEEVTGQDWMTFFNEWYLRGGHPELTVRYNYDDAAHVLRINTHQANSPDTTVLYHLPMKAGVLENGRLRIVNWSVNKRSQTDTIHYAGARPIFLPDYFHWLPGTISEQNKTFAQYYTQFTQSNDYNSKRTALEQIYGKGSPNDSAIRIYAAALTDSIPGVRYRALLLLRSVDKQSWKDALTPQLRYLATQDAHNRTRAAAFNVLGKWRDVSGTTDIAERATDDESFMVAGAALSALAVMRPDTAYTVAKRLQSKEIGGDLENTIWDAIAAKGAPADAPLFAAAVGNYYGTRKVVFAGSVYSYALATEDDAAFRRAVRLLVSMLPNESINNYRGAIGTYIFALEGFYTNAKGKKEKAQAVGRLPILQEATKEIIETERDEKVKEQYRIFRARMGLKAM